MLAHRSHLALRQDLMSMKISQLAASFKQHREWRRVMKEVEYGKGQTENIEVKIICQSQFI